VEEVKQLSPGPDLEEGKVKPLQTGASPVMSRT